MRFQRYGIAGIALVGALGLSACGGSNAGNSGNSGGGGGDLSGTIRIDGSSTVFPLTSVAAEHFMGENPGVQVTVGTSGSGGGFEKFCQGQTDISDASRPISEEERKACEQQGINYDEFTVANDALTVVVNKENTWAKCLTVDQLEKIWAPNSNVTNWNQVDSSYPNQKIDLYGPGTDSGTFDYFTEAIVGAEGESRTDYSPSEDDNVIVQGVAGSKGGLGYFGFSYYQENKDKLNAVAIDDGNGCVKPTVENAQSGEYTPLSRPLFIYPKQSALQRPEVEAFLTYYVDNARSIAKSQGFVPLNDEQQSELEEKLATLKEQ